MEQWRTLENLQKGLDKEVRVAYNCLCENSYELAPPNVMVETTKRGSPY